MGNRNAKSTNNNKDEQNFKRSKRRRSSKSKKSNNESGAKAYSATSEAASYDIKPSMQYLPQEDQKQQHKSRDQVEQKPHEEKDGNAIDTLNNQPQRPQQYHRAKEINQRAKEQNKQNQSKDIEDLSTKVYKTTVEVPFDESGVKRKQEILPNQDNKTWVNRPTEQQDQKRLLEHIMSGAPISEKDILHPDKIDRIQQSKTSSTFAEIQPTGSVYVTFDHMKDQHFLYKMDNPRRGVAMIFNIGEFLPLTGMKARAGYKKDGQLMQKTFSHLGFNVHYHEDKTTKEIHNYIAAMGAAYHGDADCFVCIIMSHGNRSLCDLVFTKDGMMHLDLIVEQFNGQNCPTLNGKPKLFFIQACRGEKLDKGEEIVDDDATRDEVDASSKTKKIPVDADILLSQATTPGYISFRNSTHGSIYIRSLHKALVKYGQTEDILTVLTRVNAMVAFEFESNSSAHPEYHGKKQMPVFTSQLTKRLIF